MHAFLGPVWDWIAGIDPEQWSAAAAGVTAVVAVVAGVVGIHQLREARRLRVEQAAPYVVAYAEVNPAAPAIVDFVIKNLGATVATDVRLTVDPPLRRAAGNSEPELVQLPDNIPVLVPGQEYRTLWDSGISRHESGLPDRHDVVVTFKDSRGARPDSFHFVLDWGPLWLRDVITVRGMHDAAEALRDMSKVIKKWPEGPGAKGIAVYVRDGDARDERIREALQERRARRQQQDAVPSWASALAAA